MIGGQMSLRIMSTNYHVRFNRTYCSLEPTKVKLGPPPTSRGIHTERQRGAPAGSPARRGGEPELSSFAVADLAPHAALFSAYFAPTFAFSHRINRPFVNEGESARGNSSISDCTD